MTIAILGSNGQIGSAVYSKLSRSFNCKAINRKILDCSKIKNVETFFKLNNYSLIINAIAYTNVDEAEKEIKLATVLNYKLPELLARIAKKQDIPFIHYSTDFVFDGNKRKPYTEKDLPNPLSIYGKTKFRGDQSVIKSRCKGAIVRVSWVYSKKGKNFLNTIHQMIKNNKKLKVVNDQWSAPTSSDLIAEVTFKLIKKLNHKLLNSIKIFHLSPKGVISRHKLTEWFIQNIKDKKNIMCKDIKPIKSSEIFSLAKRPMYSKMSSSRLEKLICYKLPSWEKHAKKFINDL